MQFAEGVERIEKAAFQETGLECVSFPQSLRVLSQGSFAKCKNLRVVVLNDGLEVLGTDEYDGDGDMTFGVFDHSAV